MCVRDIVLISLGALITFFLLLALDELRKKKVKSKNLKIEKLNAEKLNAAAIKKYRTMLLNIDIYDGTERGQVKIE